MSRIPVFGPRAAALCLLLLSPFAIIGCSSGTTTTTTSGGGGTPAAPTISSLSPASVAQGAAATTVTVNGTNFASGAVVEVSGYSVTTTYVSSTQLTISLPATQLAATGTLPIAVVSAGLISPSATFTISPPPATLTTLGYTSLLTGSGDTVLVINGTNITNGCTAYSGSTALSTTYVSTTRVTATLPAALLATPTTLSITINCSGNVSNALSLAVNNPAAPTLSTVTSPITVNAAATLSVTGTNFNASSVVQWNGANLTTNYIGATQLTAVVPVALNSTPGVNSVKVYTPAPGGGTSSAVNVFAYVSLTNNDMAYNTANGLFYLSVPGSAGTPYGNSIVSVDPATGAIGTPVFVGSDPDRIAISSDGTTAWVGIDGGSSVQQVTLTTGVLGTKIGLGSNSGIYANPPTVSSLQVIPGTTNSVVVSDNGSYSNTFGTRIFDGATVRSSVSTTTAYALQVDGTKNEIYAATSNGFQNWTYNSSGLTTKATVSTGTFGTYANSDLQLAGGRVYTDYGTIYDAEAGALLGTFYSTGTTTASGPVTADTTLGKAFVLDNPASTYQLQSFDLTTFASLASQTVPLSNLSGFSKLTRWGTNGLAFRSANGVFSLRTSLVKDLSSTVADLGVSIAANSNTAATGTNSTYTVTASNAGSAGATNVTLSVAIPSTSILVSATPSQGTCNATNCDLGSLSNGGNATVAVVVKQMSSGIATLSAQIYGSEADTNTTNNTGSATVTVSGSTYAAAPVLTAISPAAIRVGSSDTLITITGTGFTANSTAQLNGTALVTSYNSATSLSATIPAAQLANIAGGAITVTTPAPGGGTSAASAIAIYSVTAVGLNHIVYDPYSRKLMASVGSGSSTLTANSIVAITPETATFGTPVSIGSQPTYLALTSDGQILYTVLAGNYSIARFNMLTQSADFTATAPGVTNAARGIAALPGTENTIALDIAAYTGTQLFDFNTTTKTATARGTATGAYTGSSIRFLNATTMFSFDVDTSGATFDRYSVGSSGFTGGYNTETTLAHFNSFKLSGGLAYANSGGVADPTNYPAVQLGYFPSPSSYYYYATVEPDNALNRVFFATSGSANGSVTDSLIAYNGSTYLPTTTLPIPFTTLEGTSSFTVNDFIRWGQDGLAVLTSTGHLYLLRGGFVVPGLLSTGTTATVSSVSTITHASANMDVTVTGSGFARGAAAYWNGSYRTTNYVDATHLTVNLPASDVTSAGTATLSVTNPGANASNTLNVTVQ